MPEATQAFWLSPYCSAVSHEAALCSPNLPHPAHTADDLLRGVLAGGTQAQVAVAAFERARSECADAAGQAYTVRRTWWGASLGMERQPTGH